MAGTAFHEQPDHGFGGGLEVRRLRRQRIAHGCGLRAGIRPSLSSIERERERAETTAGVRRNSRRERASIVCAHSLGLVPVDEFVRVQQHLAEVDQRGRVALVHAGGSCWIGQRQLFAVGSAPR